MDYIKEEANEYAWDTNKIIYETNEDNIIDLKYHNIYLVKDNIVYIFYIKIYGTPKLNECNFLTREELLFASYMGNFVKHTVNRYQSTKCCEFCFNESDYITLIPVNRYKDFIICNNCYLNKKKEDYYVNNRLFKSIDNINIEMVKRIKNKLVYFYSIQQIYNDFNYIKLITNRWYQLANTKLCQLCHKNEKYHPSKYKECKECHQFSLNQYSIMYTKPMCLKFTDLPIDVINVISMLYIILIDFDEIDTYNYKIYHNENIKPLNIIIDPGKIENDTPNLISNAIDNVINYSKSTKLSLIKANLIEYDTEDCELTNYDDDDDDDCDLTDYDLT